ncbi:MAG: hypothetical protein ABIV28_01180 [Longimicrobiales bacterium]
MTESGTELHTPPRNRVYGIVFASAIPLLLGSCGYFNSLYNAQHRFAEAQRQEALGDRAGAYVKYDEAIERAAVTLNRYPESRWADDALLLIGRAHFAKRADAQAAAALMRLQRETQDPKIRNEAMAYLGAARVRSGLPGPTDVLDTAVANVGENTELASFAHLWRARARFAAGDSADAWRDLDKIPRSPSGTGAEAAIERLRRSIFDRDSVRWMREMAPLAAGGIPIPFADSVRMLLDSSRTRWGASFVHAAMPETIGAELPEQQRLELRLVRARFLAAAGDTASAVASGLRVARASSLQVSSSARVLVAQWLLATDADPAQMPRIRSILVPAFSSGEAVALIRAIRTLDVLIDRADAEPLAMFVAGEYARDDLRAPALARTLFLRFENLPAPTSWDAKALLAALDLSTTDAMRSEVQTRLRKYPTDLYVEAMRGAVDADAFANAEMRIRQRAVPLRTEAIAIAAAGDVSVSRAVALRDSVRAVLQRDSVLLRCNTVIDSLAVKGVRRDSTHAACIRSDSTAMMLMLRMDTMLLKPKRLDTLDVIMRTARSR